MDSLSNRIPGIAQSGVGKNHGRGVNQRTGYEKIQKTPSMPYLKRGHDAGVLFKLVIIFIPKSDLRISGFRYQRSRIGFRILIFKST